ncbi:MAG: ABC transporter substrate-binding protein, partial [Flavonifractor plautii]
MESPAAGTEAPSAPETVTITSLNADKEAVELEVPYDPQRIAILDMASLDILDALGVAGGRVVGSADTSLDYLQSYVTDENVANLGTIKTADLEAVMAAQPDVIFI